MIQLVERPIDPSALTPVDGARLRWRLLRARASRLLDRINSVVSRVWMRIRGADTSTVMLVFGLLIALVIVLTLALGPVHRRH